MSGLFANRQKILICLVLSVGTASVYWPVHRYDFVNYDDIDYVVENTHVRGGLTPDGVRWAFTTGHSGNWHPLTWLSHMADVQLFGLNPGAHHVVNLFIHIANTLLIFLLLARMTRVLWPSAMVAAFFAWHPLHVESVAWIAERKDVLSTFFALLSLWAYARYADSGRRRHLWLALLWFAFGLMAKPMLVTLPFVFLLVDYWPLERISTVRAVFDPRQSPNLIREKVPFFVLTAVSSIVTYTVQRNAGAVAALEAVPLPYRFLNVPLAYASYLQETFLPTTLAVIYPIVRIFSLWQVAAALTVLVAISIVAVYWVGLRPWFFVGWFWFLGMLVPVIGLIQVGSQARADRYTYLPLVGIFVMLAWSAAEVAPLSRFASKLAAITSILTVSAGLAVTSTQIQTWSNSQALFEHAIAVTKNNYIAHGILGRVLANRGQVDEAQAHFEEVLRIFPNKSDAHFSLGVILAQKGRFEDAIAHYQQAIEANPDAGAHYNLGNTLMKLGRWDEAIVHFEEAARLDPQMAEAQNNWAYALTTKGRLPEAAEHYAAALRLKPDLPEARLNAARIREQLGAIDSH